MVMCWEYHFREHSGFHFWDSVANGGEFCVLISDVYGTVGTSHSHIYLIVLVVTLFQLHQLRIGHRSVPVSAIHQVSQISPFFFTYIWRIVTNCPLCMLTLSRECRVSVKKIIFSHFTTDLWVTAVFSYPTWLVMRSGWSLKETPFSRWIEYWHIGDLLIDYYCVVGHTERLIKTWFHIQPAKFMVRKAVLRQFFEVISSIFRHQHKFHEYLLVLVVDTLTVDSIWIVTKFIQFLWMWPFSTVK
jgi:hypothetical protein